MKIKLRTTERGFAVGEFRDLYGDLCSIQKSCMDGGDTLVAKDAIWLGRRGSTRMHLDREMVKALLPLLKRFVKTGELEP